MHHTLEGCSQGATAQGATAQGTPAQATTTQAPPANVQALPPLEVRAPASGIKRGHPQSAARIVSAPARIPVYATAPLGGKGTDVDKLPSTVSLVDSKQIARAGSLNITDALQQNVPAINISEVSGNPFQPSVQFRGFDSSPVSGTPQGLAVYQNGVRINEAFGDTVNWDLIPENAIDHTAIVAGNPIFGLNAIGGAITMTMKNGFTWQGFEGDVRGGSFGRAQEEFQYGKEIGNYSVYVAGAQINSLDAHIDLVPGLAVKLIRLVPPA